MVHDIKCVIWDLDETLWSGTLAEGETPCPRPAITALIPKLDRHGIINSVCSKNNIAAARPVLERMGIWEYVVFPVIAFAPKGEAIRGIIERLQLRAANVLFVDDNAANRLEALHYNPGLMTGDANDEGFLADMEAVVKDARGPSRLEQYRVLERKSEARGSYSSNTDFLRDSRITVCLVRNPADLMYKDRIVELANRANQLNFTTSRFAPGEFEALVERPGVVHGCVFAYDRHGDYGLSGFFAFDESPRRRSLSHFVFSCRIMNMGIEQAVYARLREHFGVEPLAALEKALCDTSYLTVREGLDEHMAGHLRNRMQLPECYRSAIIAGCTSGVIDHYLPDSLRPARYDLFHLEAPQVPLESADVCVYAVYGDYGNDAWPVSPFSYDRFRNHLSLFLEVNRQMRIVLILASEKRLPHGRRNGWHARCRGWLSDMRWGKTHQRMMRCNALVRSLCQHRSGVTLMDPAAFIREPAEQIDPRHFERVVIQRLCEALPRALALRAPEPARLSATSVGWMERISEG